MTHQDFWQVCSPEFKAHSQDERSGTQGHSSPAVFCDAVWVVELLVDYFA